MKIINKTMNVKSLKSEQFIDITSKIQLLVNEEKIESGMVHIFVPHTTAAITINENTDPHVKTDILMGLSHAFPNHKAFLHFEGNSHAHLKSSVIGNDQTIMIDYHELKLGRWQAIYFCEFDGPRQRTIHIQIVGE